jgi:hypothetical protein
MRYNRLPDENYFHDPLKGALSSKFLACFAGRFYHSDASANEFAFASE